EARRELVDRVPERPDPHAGNGLTGVAVDHAALEGQARLQSEGEARTVDYVPGVLAAVREEDAGVRGVAGHGLEAGADDGGGGDLEPGDPVLAEPGEREPPVGIGPGLGHEPREELGPPDLTLVVRDPVQEAAVDARLGPLVEVGAEVAALRHHEAN